MRSGLVSRLARPCLVCLTCTVAFSRVSGQSVPPPPPPPSAAIAVAVPAPAPGAQASPLSAALPPPLDFPGPLPSFDVASVKKLPKGATVTTSGSRTPGGGRITVMNLPLKSILILAFGIRDYQIVDAPGWSTTDRFSINAKAGSNAPRDQVLLMLRALLIERFQLKHHVEKRELPAYVLTTLTTPWKPSARMKPVDCTAGRAGRAGAPPAAAAAAAAGVVLLSSATSPCGGLSLSGTTIRGNGIPIATFVSLMGSLGGLGTIHDRTGLTGTYQIEIEASLSSLASRSMTSAATPDSPMPTLADTGPSLASALKDVGLKLERRREPTEVLVVESVSLPDED